MLLQMFGINMFVIFVLVGIVMAAEWATLTEPSDYDFTITSTEASNMVDAIDLGQKEIDSAGGAAVASMPERSNLGERNKLFQVFTAQTGGNIFTPSGLLDICKAEALLIEADEFAAGRATYESRDDEYPGICMLVRALPLLPTLRSLHHSLTPCISFAESGCGGHPDGPGHQTRQLRESLHRWSDSAGD